MSQADPDATRHELRNGDIVYSKKKPNLRTNEMETRYYDEHHNEIPIEDIKGKLLGGPCGHPGCQYEGSVWDDSSFVPHHRYVCDYHAKEKNDRARAMALPNEEITLPCVPVPS